MLDDIDQRPPGQSGADRVVVATELRQLVALITVADEGSFTRAALRLGYTQSAISHQIATLERLVGRPLVERPSGSRSLTLTDAGERLRDHACDIVARVAKAHADIDGSLQATTDTLHLGTFQTASVRVLPLALRRLVDGWPRVRVRLTETVDPAETLQAVAKGTLDAAFALAPVADGPFRSLEVLRDAFVLIVATDSSLADRRTPLDLDEVARLPLIAANPVRSDQGLEAQMRARGYAPNVVMRSDDTATIQALVAAGVGAAVVPRQSVERSHPVTALDLCDGLAERVTVLAWRRDQPVGPALGAFIEIVRSVAAAGTGSAKKSAALRQLTASRQSDGSRLSVCTGSS